MLIVPSGQVFVADRSDEQRNLLINLSGRNILFRDRCSVLLVPGRQVFVAYRPDEQLSVLSVRAWKIFVTCFCYLFILSRWVFRLWARIGKLL